MGSNQPKTNLDFKQGHMCSGEKGISEFDITLFNIPGDK